MTSDIKNEQFDPIAWANLNNNQEASEPQTSTSSSVSLHASSDTNAEDLESQIRDLTTTLTQRGIDITKGYTNWLNLGFALADGLGEAGRQYYHDLSRMNSDYNTAECDKQYNACLRSHRSGVTIKTFFMMAKDAGIDIREVARDSFHKCAVCANAQQYAKRVNNVNPLILNTGIIDEQQCANAQTAHLPDSDELNLAFNLTFSDKIPEDYWCEYFKTVNASMDDAESKDKMILGTIDVNSGIIPNYYGLYGGHIIYPPMYIIFYGPSASRKGEIGCCSVIIKPLKNEIIGQYQKEMEAYREAHAIWESKGAKAADKAERGEEPKEPEYRSPIIPANNSASAAYQALNANDGWGIMFETEAHFQAIA